MQVLLLKSFINVTYYKNAEVFSRFTLRGGKSYYIDDNGMAFEPSSAGCRGYTHYIKGWNDLSVISSRCTCIDYNYEYKSIIYGALIEFPEFVGVWEIDMENSNDYGIQYLQGILVEK